MAPTGSNREPICDGWRRRVRWITAGVAAGAVVAAATITGALAAAADQSDGTTSTTEPAPTAGQGSSPTGIAPQQPGSGSLVAPRQAPGSGSGRGHARSGGS